MFEHAVLLKNTDNPLCFWIQYSHGTFHLQLLEDFCVGRTLDGHFDFSTDDNVSAASHAGIIALKALLEDRYDECIDGLQAASSLVEEIASSRVGGDLGAVLNNNIGCFYRRRGKDHAALKYFDQALECNPSSECRPFIDINLALTEILCQKMSSATDHMNSCLAAPDLNIKLHVYDVEGKQWNPTDSFHVQVMRVASQISQITGQTSESQHRLAVAYNLAKFQLSDDHPQTKALQVIYEDMLTKLSADSADHPDQEFGEEILTLRWEFAMQPSPEPEFGPRLTTPMKLPEPQGHEDSHQCSPLATDGQLQADELQAIAEALENVSPIGRPSNDLPAMTPPWAMDRASPAKYDDPVTAPSRLLPQQSPVVSPATSPHSYSTLLKDVSMTSLTNKITPIRSAAKKSTTLRKIAPRLSPAPLSSSVKKPGKSTTFAAGTKEPVRDEQLDVAVFSGTKKQVNLNPAPPVRRALTDEFGDLSTEPSVENLHRPKSSTSILDRRATKGTHSRRVSIASTDSKDEAHRPGSTQPHYMKPTRSNERSTKTEASKRTAEDVFGSQADGGVDALTVSASKTRPSSGDELKRLPSRISPLAGSTGMRRRPFGSSPQTVTFSAAEHKKLVISPISAMKKSPPNPAKYNMRRRDSVSFVSLISGHMGFKPDGSSSLMRSPTSSRPASPPRALNTLDLDLENPLSRESGSAVKPRDRSLSGADRPGSSGNSPNGLIPRSLMRSRSETQLTSPVSAKPDYKAFRSEPDGGTPDSKHLSESGSTVHERLERYLHEKLGGDSGLGYSSTTSSNSEDDSERKTQQGPSFSFSLAQKAHTSVVVNSHMRTKAARRTGRTLPLVSERMNSRILISNFDYELEPEVSTMNTSSNSLLTPKTPLASLSKPRPRSTSPSPAHVSPPPSPSISIFVPPTSISAMSEPINYKTHLSALKEAWSLPIKIRERSLSAASAQQAIGPRCKTYSWGSNTYAQLGLENHAKYLTPSLLSITGRVTEVACGDEFTLFKTLDSQVYGCGRNDNGQLGLGDCYPRLEPCPLDLLKKERVASIACGADFAVCISTAGNLFTWGNNDNGQLGRGNRVSPAQCSVPTVVNFPDNVICTQVSCGEGHSLALTLDGTVFSWGNGNLGQLGHDREQNEYTPREIQLLEGKQVIFVACGAHHSVVVANNGRVSSWGSNEYGQLGTGGVIGRTKVSGLKPTLRRKPTSIMALAKENITFVACGYAHTIVITSEGHVYSFGLGRYGQLGRGSEADSSNPVEVSIAHKISRASCGAGHTALLTESGQIYAFGWGQDGCLGHGSEISKPIPVAIDLPNKVVSIACGGMHTVAVTQVSSD